MAIKNCKKVNEPAKSFDNIYQGYFYVYLPKFIKSWGELVTFIDGSKSGFHIGFETLTKAKVDFNVQISDYGGGGMGGRGMDERGMGGRGMGRRGMGGRGERSNIMTIEEMTAQAQELFGFVEIGRAHV